MGDLCDVFHPVFDEGIFDAEYCRNTGFHFHDAQHHDVCLRINEHAKPSF
jgi:hypothetical protein